MSGSANGTLLTKQVPANTFKPNSPPPSCGTISTEAALSSQSIKPNTDPNISFEALKPNSPQPMGVTSSESPLSVRGIATLLRNSPSIDLDDKPNPFPPDPCTWVSESVEPAVSGASFCLPQVSFQG